MARAAERIAELRTGRGLSQQELADQLYVSRSLVAMWESGARLPDGFNVARMADIFGVSESDIIGDGKYAYCSPEELCAVDSEIAEFTDPGGKPDPLEKRVDLIRDFLSEQSRKNSEIFMARYFRMETHKTIAAELNMSETAVRVRLTRMRQKLRKALAREEHNDKQGV